MDMGPPTLPLSAAKHPNGDHLRGEAKQPKYPKAFDSHRLCFLFLGTVRSCRLSVFSHKRVRAHVPNCHVSVSRPPTDPEVPPRFPHIQV